MQISNANTNIPVLADEIFAVPQQVLFGWTTEFQRPKVVQSHLRRA